VYRLDLSVVIVEVSPPPSVIDQNHQTREHDFYGPNACRWRPVSPQSSSCGEYLRENKG
jgi:hypothetical protein